MSDVGNVHQNRKACVRRGCGPPFPHSSWMIPGQDCPGVTSGPAPLRDPAIAEVQAKRKLVQGSQPKPEEASGGDALGGQGLESRRSDG